MTEESKPKSKKEKELEAIEEMKEKTRLTYFDADKREVKSLKEILAKTTVKQEIYIPQLGCKVKIGHVTMTQFAKMDQLKDKNEMAMEMLFQLMHSGDPEVTKKEVEKLPFQITTAIITQILGGEMGFPEAKP